MIAEALIPPPPRENDEECHDLEIVDPLKLPFLRVRASRREEAGDGAFLLLTQNGRDGGLEPLLGLGHVLAVWVARSNRGSLGVGQVPAAAELFQTVENLFDLGEREQDAAVFTNMNQVVRGQRVSRLDGRTRRFAFGSETEDHAWRNRRVARAGRGGDGEGAQGQVLEPLRVVFEETGQVDPEIVERQVGDRDAAGEVFEVNDRVLELAAVACGGTPGRSSGCPTAAR